MNHKTVGDLMEYLERHEQDIALEINDYGDLRGLFVQILGRWPVGEENGRKHDVQQPESYE